MSKAKFYKEINFDLDTSEMKKQGIYPNGYRQLEKSFFDNGFIHRQGSGYLSLYALDQEQVLNKVTNIIGKNDWLNDCVKKFDVTDVGKQFDLMNFIKNSCNGKENIKNNKPDAERIKEMFGGARKHKASDKQNTKLDNNIKE